MKKEICSFGGKDYFPEYKKCRKVAYYKINNKPYCYEHNKLMEIEHFLKYH